MTYTEAEIEEAVDFLNRIAIRERMTPAMEKAVDTLIAALRDAREEIDKLRKRDGLIFVEDGATWKERAEKAEFKLQQIKEVINNAKT